MIPAFSDSNLDVYIGDVRAVLRELPDASVDAVLTSPPYWQQRSYLDPDDPEKHREIGLEATLAEWVDVMVELAREYRRILKPSGSFWLNLGDKYVANGGIRSGPGPAPDGRRGLEVAYERRVEVREALDRFGRAWTLGWPEGVKKKSLTLAPFRVALRLTDSEGWILRDSIVWWKQNAKPDSAPNRFGRRHEMLFRFTLGRNDYFDLDAVREPYAPSTIERAARGAQIFGGNARRKEYASARPRSGRAFELAKGANPGDVWPIATASREGAKTEHVAPFPPALIRRPILSTVPPGGVVLDPFAGSGTVGAVANALGRRAILVELDGRMLDEIVDRTMRRMDVELGATDVVTEPAPGLFEELVG